MIYVCIYGLLSALCVIYMYIYGLLSALCVIYICVYMEVWLNCRRAESGRQQWDKI